MIGKTNTGGGSGLNFKVTAYSSEEDLVASKPTENTIAIITNTTIAEWIFSSHEPSSPEVGMVWITIGASSAVGFNALKKNGIMIYPINAKQYIGGLWTDVVAKSFQGGVWVDWWIDGTLFANGTDGTDLTGGWKSSAYSAGSGYAPVTETFEISPDGMSIILDDTGGTYRSTFIGTENMIDVSEYSKLVAEFSEAVASIANTGAVQVRLYSDDGYTTAKSADVLSSGGLFADRVEIDVSGLSGKYYIGTFLWKWNQNCKVSANMTLMRLS